MFSLKETEGGEFIYSRVACGWKCDLLTEDKVTASEYALVCNQVHDCNAEHPEHWVRKVPKRVDWAIPQSIFGLLGTPNTSKTEEPNNGEPVRVRQGRARQNP
jgi:hypothetical protein